MIDLKIGVLSDTHIPQRARELPESLVKGFSGVDMILHAGDLVSEEVLQVLEGMAPCHAVRGNMDGPALQKRLPEKKEIKLGKVRIGLLHGHGMGGNALQKAQVEFGSRNLDVVVFGHSHHPYNEKHRGCLFFNPGSPTDKRWVPFFSYGFLHIDDEKVTGEIIKF